VIASNKKTTTENKVEKAEPVVLHKMALKSAVVRIQGTSSLIVHKFSEKSLRQIQETQSGSGKAKGKAKGVRKPEDEFNGARYVLDKKKGIDGFPASGFKKAAVRAGTYQGEKMTHLRGAFHVMGDVIPIICKKGAKMRTDPVRIGNGVCDIRYRPEYQNWSCELPITYNSKVISLEQIVNLFEVAGFAVGIGDWRPEKDGQFGMFEVKVK